MIQPCACFSASIKIFGSISALIESIEHRLRGATPYSTNEAKKDGNRNVIDTYLTRLVRTFSVLLGPDHLFGVSVFARGSRQSSPLLELSSMPSYGIWKRSSDSDLLLKTCQTHGNKLTVYFAAPLLLNRAPEGSKAAGKKKTDK